MMALSFLAFTFYAAWRLTRREAVPQEEMSDFTYAPPVASAQTPEALQLYPQAEESSG